MNILILLIVVYSFLVSIAFFVILKVNKKLENDSIHLSNEVSNASEQVRHSNNQINSLRDQVEEIRHENSRLSSAKYKQEIADKAVAQSRSVNKGYVSEEILPLIQKQYDLKDFKHLGAPIDYVVFAGLNSMNEGRTDKVDKIVLLEIKTGKAALTKSERAVRNAILAGRVVFEIRNTDTNEIKTYSHPSFKQDDPEAINIKK